MCRHLRLHLAFCSTRGAGGTLHGLLTCIWSEQTRGAATGGCTNTTCCHQRHVWEPRRAGCRPSSSPCRVTQDSPSEDDDAGATRRRPPKRRAGKAGAQAQRGCRWSCMTCESSQQHASAAQMAQMGVSQCPAGALWLAAGQAAVARTSASRVHSRCPCCGAHAT